MRQKVLSIFTLSLLLAGLSNLFAQNYLDLAPNDTLLSYLNDVIYADTTEDGGRVPDRVYRLEPGGIYYYNNTIVVNGDLKIIAKDTTAEWKKAIILTGINDKGKTPKYFAQVTGDVLYKNLYFSGVSTKDLPIQDITRVYKDEAIIEMENCFVEWPKAHVFRVYSSNTSLYARDNYIRNITSVGGPFNGKFAGFEDNPVNEIVFQNNTVVNMQGVMFKIRFNTVNRFMFDHNTVVNTMKWPFHFEYWTNGQVTNNIFFNTSSYGESEADASNQDLGQLQFGIINMYSIPDSLLSQAGLSDSSERRMEVHNNLYYFDQKVQDYLAKWWEADTVREGPWMNERVQGWFDDDTAFPYLNGEEPIREDPGFVEYPRPDSMIKKMDDWRENGTKGYWFWVDDDGDKIGNATDRPHDLTFPESSVAYTAADGGFPLGDLNWFPDKKAEWITAIDEKDNVNLQPTEFTLKQNYPNPFNPTTTIEFYAPKAVNVNIAVYNVLGQKVEVLLDKKVTAGSHTVSFNAKNLASGVYLYKLEAGDFTSYKKMILMK